MYGYFLKDHDPGELRRSDFLGVADESKLPEWAAEKLAEIREPEKSEEITEEQEEQSPC